MYFVEKKNFIFINNCIVFNRIYRIKYRFGFVDRISLCVCIVIVFFCFWCLGCGWFVLGFGFVLCGCNFFFCIGLIFFFFYV